MKKVIWITGSMSAGKSTQRRLLCNEFADSKPKEFTGTENGKTYHYTSFGSMIACLGKVKQVEDAYVSMCDGLDAVFGKVKKEGGLYSVHKALQNHAVVVIEGSQTSPSWAAALQQTLTDHNAELYLVHLYLSYEQAFRRLKQRQISKFNEQEQEAITHPDDYELTDKNIESIIGKCRQFNSCFDKVEGFCQRKRIDARASKENIFEQIIEFVFADT